MVRAQRRFPAPVSSTYIRGSRYRVINEGTVKNMRNFTGARTQHLNRRQASSREDVREGRCDPQSVPGRDNPAGALTKSLPTADFTKHANHMLGLTHLRNISKYHAIDSTS